LPEEVNNDPARAFSGLPYGLSGVDNKDTASLKKGNVETACEKVSRATVTKGDH
jgi:hypothetical protein